MTAVLTLFIVLALSLVVTRVATVAVTATGLSREAARFQARATFNGSGSAASSTARQRRAESARAARSYESA